MCLQVRSVLTQHKEYFKGLMNEENKRRLDDLGIVDQEV